MSHKPRVNWGDAATVPGFVADTLADERRWSMRKKSIIAGLVVSDRLQGTASCIVRDLSATGAQVDLKLTKTCVVGSVNGLPDQFIIVMPRENAEVPCEIAWRRGQSVGVRFIGGFRPIPVKPVIAKKK